MPQRIDAPVRVSSAGNKPKLIDEYFGRARSDTDDLSIAHMRSPGGWIEPYQRPEFDEYTLVLRGVLRVDHDSGTLDVAAGQGVLVRVGERVRYSTPDAAGAEYIAVCRPAFTLARVRREDAEK